jgi:uncharacterized protein (TIGR02145 family)
MNNRNFLHQCTLIIILALFFTGCKKDDNNKDKLTDIDGNKYDTITIGTQVWMAENLKTTRYNSGELIPNITDNTQWNTTTSGAFCKYDNVSSNSDTYGHLYNWFAIQDSRKLCPKGWHIPTDEEWMTLISRLGGVSVAGGKMKDALTDLWSSGYGATNDSGFSAIPGGFRVGDGIFSSIGDMGMWWSLTETDGAFAYYWTLTGYSNNVFHDIHYKATGHSVRCIKDR